MNTVKKSTPYEEIDLTIALQVLRKLQFQDGDLGYAYWHQISHLLREAAAYRQRALVAERRIRQLRGTPKSDIERDIAFLSRRAREELSTEHSIDIARMQNVLESIGKECDVDELILVWYGYSNQQQAVWKCLPTEDQELLAILLVGLKDYAGR